MHSTTHWILQIGQGNREAADQLWQRYYRRLVAYARDQLRSRPRCLADEEDIALSAFNSFYRAAEAGRFPDLDGSDSLWRLLITIAARKASSRVRAENCQKRGGRRIEDSAAESIHEHPDSDPDPQLVLETIDTCRSILAGLGDGSLALVAIRRMEGYSNEEIAGELACSLRTIERKLGIIRRHFIEAGTV